MVSHRKFVLALTAMLCALLVPGSSARAQAGVEAGMVTLQSAQAATGAGRLGDRFRLPAIPGSPRLVSGERSDAPAALPARPRSGAPGAVRGRLVDGSGQPISGVAVGLVSTDSRYAVEQLEAVSDSAGEFVFETVEPGPWEVRFDPTKLPARFAPRRGSVAFTLARRETETLADIPFLPGACAGGAIRWKDGQPALETEILFAPEDTSFFSVAGIVDGEGEYRLCGIPAGAVHAWNYLGDGRWLGRRLAIATGTEARYDLQVEPPSSLRGSTVWFDVRTEDGRSIAHAELVVFGRRAGTDEEPQLVYLRGATTDRGGAAEFLLPYGEYEVLAMNPREGEWVRVEGFVVSETTPRQLDQGLALAGTSTERERRAWVADLRGRAERAIYAWSAPEAASP